MIEQSEYLDVIKKTQLVSVDLVIVNQKDEVLLGKRKNNPAKGYYFVPGSRIYKNELVNNAITRVSKWELGIEILREDVEPIGVFEHQYNTNFVNNDFGTHYVCFAYKYRLMDGDVINNSEMNEQHDDTVWMSVNELLENDDVHDYVKNYFRYADNKIM